MIENVGEVEWEAFDDANVPVDIWVHKRGSKDFDEEEAGDFNFSITANNYMPRKARLGGEQICQVFCHTEDEVRQVLTAWRQIYLQAMSKFDKMIDTCEGNLYYWAHD